MDAPINEDKKLKDLSEALENCALEIAESKKREEDLNQVNRGLVEAKAKYEAMLSNIGDGVIGVNDRGEIVYANSQATLLTGYPQDQLIGKMLIHSPRLTDEKGNEIPHSENPIRNAFLGNSRISSRGYFYEKADGSKFPVAITATPVVLWGQVIGGVNVFRDITREWEVDRMKTEFISLASHQLRTPLSAMKWFSEMLIDGDVGNLTDEQKEMVGNIYESNERMIALVNSLLNISRIESGRIIIEPTPTALTELLGGVMSDLKQKIESKGHEIILDVSPLLPKVNIDAKLVRHVYLNLISNSIKYTPERGRIEIKIELKGNQVVSLVSDNGYGIPERQKDKVFSNCFRA